MVPTPVLEVSYTDPTAAPSWVDESARLISASVRRGRNDETGAMETGTAVLVLDDRDGYFTATNVSSPRYGSLFPGRRVRLQADVDSGVSPMRMRTSRLRGGHLLRAGVQRIPLWTGFIETMERSIAEADSPVQVVRCVDLMALLATARFDWGYRYTGGAGNEVPICGQGSGNVYPDTGPPFVPDDRTDVRIGRILDCVGWPAADRDLDVGLATVWGSDQSAGGNTNIRVSGTALQHAQDVAALEDGAFFMDARGRAVFRSAMRSRVLDADGSEEREYELYGDGGHGVLVGPVMELRDPLLANVVTVAPAQRNLASSATVSDDASKSRYGEREMSVTVPTAAFSHLRWKAVRLLAEHKDVRPRVLQIRPLSTTAEDWRRVLAKELLERVRIRRLFGTGGLLDQVSRIEGISVDLRAGRWDVVWDVSALARNLLSLEAEDFEASTGGWVAETNCSIGWSTTAPALMRAGKLTLTATAAGDASARSPSVAVDAGYLYEASAWVRSGTTPLRSVRVDISWRNAADTEVATSSGSVVTEGGTGNSWRYARVEAEAPMGAARAAVRVTILASGAGQVHDIDFVRLVPVIAAPWKG